MVRLNRVEWLATDGVTREDEKLGDDRGWIGLSMWPNKPDELSNYPVKRGPRKVVRPKADSIDFTGFRPLLTNLSAAINEHRASA